MYCNNCRQFFSDYEIVTKKGELGEPLACCPFCGVDDLSDTVTCKGCGEDFLEDDLSSGFCIDCLWDSIDYDITLAYLKDEGLLAEFIVGFIFGADVPKRSSLSFDNFLEETFKRMVANDKLLGWHEFLDKCRDFCIPKKDNGFCSESNDFAEWYDDYLDRQKKEARA